MLSCGFSSAVAVRELTHSTPFQKSGVLACPNESVARCS